MPHVPKLYVIGPEPSRWCKFHKVKGNYTEDFYQLKKEIKCLIQEGHLNKYVRGDSAQMPGESNSQGRDAFGSYGSKKGKESSKGARKNLCTTPLTPCKGFIGAGILVPLTRDTLTRS